MLVLNQSFHRLAVFLLGTLALSACASPAVMQNMVVSPQPVESVAPSPFFSNAMVVARVGGGETTNPLWTSEVGNAAFQGALSASLEKNGLLADTRASSRFDLFANLASLNQPMFGLDMKVSSSVKYRVVERKTELTWYEDLISASYTATFGDSAFGIQRLRLANEGSIRENIKKFITQLSKTRPPTVSNNDGTSSEPYTSSKEEVLRDLKKLLDDGLISQEDYDLKRAQILKDI